MALILTIALLFIGVTGLLLLVFAYTVVFNHLLPLMSFGAIFAGSTLKITEKIVLLSEIKPTKRFVDLGSGDGVLVIAMAKAGIEAHGYEINPFLVLLSAMRIKKAGLSGKAFVHWGNFWDKDFSQFDIVSVYGISFIMKKLETKLKKELKPNARVISNYSIFPNWQPSESIDNVHVYIKNP